MVKVAKPTGDPTCPPHARKEKQLMRKITEKADATAEVEDHELGIVSVNLDGSLAIAEADGALEIDSSLSTPRSLVCPLAKKRAAVTEEKPSAMEDLIKIATLNMVNSAEERKQDKRQRKEDKKMQSMMIVDWVEQRSPMASGRPLKQLNCRFYLEKS